MLLNVATAIKIAASLNQVFLLMALSGLFLCLKLSATSNSAIAARITEAFTSYSPGNGADMATNAFGGQ